MDIIAGLVILLTAILVVALLAYIVKPPKKPKIGKTVAVPKIEKRVKRASPIFQNTSEGGVFIPKEIPRTIETIKVMTQDSPDLVVGIIKSWLREKG